MALMLPIEELAERVTEEAPCGILTDAIEGELMAMDDAIRRLAEKKPPDFAPRSTRKEVTVLMLERVANGLFRGGEILNLADPEAQATIQVKPIRHLKPAMVLVLTGLVSEGIPGFSDGLELIEKLVVNHWPDLHPVANPDNPEDPYLRRVNVLSPLAFGDPARLKVTPGAVLGDDPWRIEERLLATRLLESDRTGALSLRDCLSPWAKNLRLSLPPGEDRSAATVHEFRLAATEMLPRQQEAVHNALVALGSIDQVFREAPGALKLNFEYLSRLLNAALAVLEDRVAPEQVPRTATNTVSPTPVSTSGNGASLGDREEAMRKLSEVAEYFRRHEPGSPIPPLVDRVKRLAMMSFMGLLEELKLGDHAVPEFRKLAGIPEPGSATRSAGSTEEGKKSIE